MKYWIVSILFLSSLSSTWACGSWYPYGEDTRFSLLNPGWFDNGGFSDFYYSVYNFGETYTFSAASDQNTKDWWLLLDKEISKETIFQVVYGFSPGEIERNTDHPMLKKLRNDIGQEYIDYLLFAKVNSHLNNGNQYWERDEKYQNSQRNNAALKAEKMAENTNDEWLTRRYAFQALRFYFYNDDAANVNRIFEQYFSGKSKWAIDKWAEYHQLHFEEDVELKTFKAAQLFPDVVSKRRMIWRMFNEDFRKEDILQHAQTNKERANVLAMYLVRDKSRTLSKIQEIYNLDPANEMLNFLIVREVNKLENWVLGPEITAFSPVIHPDDYPYSVEQKIIDQGIKEDRVYANRVLNWIENKGAKLKNEVRDASIVTISLITKQYQKGLDHLRETSFSQHNLNRWKSNMISLLKVKNKNIPTINDIAVKELLSPDYENRNSFLFAVGRSFEFKNNLSDALLLYSQLGQEESYFTDFAWSESDGTTVFNRDFYVSAFDYFNANYDASQLEKCIKHIEKIHKNSANQTLTSAVLNDKWNWYDLVGTKYLREEQLERSISIWKEVPTSYWSSDAHNYQTYLNANPFYAHLYSNHKPTKGDTVSYNKLEIVQELKKRIDRSKTLNGDEKAWELFHIANCYYNMTQYGNSWMMKRYYWSSVKRSTILVDDEDYNQCINAKKYYLKAKKSAKTEKFKALCLRMAGRCASYAQQMTTGYNEYPDDRFASYTDYIYHTNKYYKQLQKEFPDDQEQLLTNCHSFERYYNSLR